MPCDPKFINEKVHPGNLIRENDSLRIIDWGTARADESLFELVRMSFTSRTPNSRFLKCLQYCCALSVREPTAEEKNEYRYKQLFMIFDGILSG